MTIERARTQPGWTVTQLGRLIRPVRMRPDHPLDPPLDVARTAAKGKDGKEGKRRRKKVEVATRARRKLIDPLRWGSTHVKGVFLEGQAVGLQAKVSAVEEERQESEDSEDSDASEEMSQPTARESLSALGGSSSLSPPKAAVQRAPAPEPAPSPAHVSTSVTAASTSDLQTEKKETLSLLASLFSGEDWGGTEDLSDVEMDAPKLASRPIARETGEDVDFEVVPRTPALGQIAAVGDIEEDSHSSAEPDALEDSSDVDDADVNDDVGTSNAPPAAVTQANRLAELFAPQEEQGKRILIRIPYHL